MPASLAVIDDPWFYVTVPLMSLTITPARAAAILLPIPMLMDVTALRKQSFCDGVRLTFAVL